MAAQLRQAGEYARRSQLKGGGEMDNTTTKRMICVEILGSPVKRVLVHRRIFWSRRGPCFLGARSYPSAITHSAFLDQPRRRRPRPNENCPLRMRWASSMPAIVMAAFANDLNPAIDAQRRLI